MSKKRELHFTPDSMDPIATSYLKCGKNFFTRVHSSWVFPGWELSITPLLFNSEGMIWQFLSDITLPLNCSKIGKYIEPRSAMCKCIRWVPTFKAVWKGVWAMSFADRFLYLHCVMFSAKIHNIYPEFNGPADDHHRILNPPTSPLQQAVRKFA